MLLREIAFMPLVIILIDDRSGWQQAGSQVLWMVKSEIHPTLVSKATSHELSKCSSSQDLVEPLAFEVFCLFEY